MRQKQGTKFIVVGLRLFIEPIFSTYLAYFSSTKQVCPVGGNTFPVISVKYKIGEMRIGVHNYSLGE